MAGYMDDDWLPPSEDEEEALSFATTQFCSSHSQWGLIFVDDFKSFTINFGY